MGTWALIVVVSHDQLCSGETESLPKIESGPSRYAEALIQVWQPREKLVLVVVAGNGPSLFGPNWLKHLKLDWRNMVVVQTVKWNSLSILMKKHQVPFSDDLGTVKLFKAKLQVQPDVTPQFIKH